MDIKNGAMLFANDGEGLGDLLHIAGAGVGEGFACSHLPPCSPALVHRLPTRT